MSSEQEFKCVFCCETFSQKEDLQTHFRKHADPQFNQKKPKGRSQDEIDVSAEKPKDQTSLVECDVCSEAFSTISKAITHKHKVHPDQDTKYFCPWCGKLFTMKHLYNKHIQASHSEMIRSEERLFHCDSCDVDFNIAAAVAYHNKFYHRQDELPTLGHSKKLKMIQEEVIQIYYCPFCGEEYDNKVNLHKHMSDDHCSENQRPDDLFRCPLCDAIFYYLDAYELHLTYHSIEDLYTERNEMIDEITDFSLETVQPLQEKVESVDPVNVQEPTAIGIEQLLEFTMDDAPDIRKSKKHKKHKKSKKAAITLDEFLNMNKDVFGEGIDFQGIEEVPTQVVAKRLKTKKAVPTSKFKSSDIAKLKRQGIVVKKQPTKVGKPITMSKGSIQQSAIKPQQNVSPNPQTKSNTLTSTDDVLSKLLNQGSQIKIVKKSNQDTEELISKEDSIKDNIKEGNMPHKSEKTENNEGNNCASGVTEIEEKNTKTSEQNVDTKSSKIYNDEHESLRAFLNPESPSVIGNNKDLNNLLNFKEGSNDSAKSNTEECHDHSEKATHSLDNSNVLQNNSNIAIKLCKQNASITKDNLDNLENNGKDEIKLNTRENIENNTATLVSEKSSLNALKHLSHLITIKPVSSSKAIPLSADIKSENNFSKAEMANTSHISQNNHAKASDIKHFTDSKSLGGITIKPTSQSRLTSSKSNQLVEKKDNNNEDHEADDEWDEDKSEVNKVNADKIANVLKSPQLNVQTKHSPKAIQKESPVGTHDNDNSQSSADLLKHLKNVTAKPVNINSQKITTPQSSPSYKKTTITKTSLQKEVTEDGIEIFNIDDSDSDEANCNKPINNTIVKIESKIEPNKSIDALKNINKNITVKSTNQQCKIVNKEAERHFDKTLNNKDDDWTEDCDEKESDCNTINPKFSSPKLTQKNVAINNVLKSLSKNITVKSRNSSPSQPVQPQEHNSRDTYLETNEDDSDSDSPLSQVKITEIENKSDDEFLEDFAEPKISQGNVKVQHPDDSYSENDDEPMDEDFDDMSDIESQIAAAKVQKDNSKPSSSLNSLKHIGKDLTIKSSNNKTPTTSKPENSLSSEGIPTFAKNLSNQISIKQFKKPENKNTKPVEQTAGQPMNQSLVNERTANTSNQVNTFNKEVKTVKTFQTQTKTVIQEITTTVTKTIKTVNQTMKQEVRNMPQSNNRQKVQGMNANFSQNNFQGVKVRQSVPNVRPKIRGQAPQTMRPAICAPPQGIKPVMSAPIRASNQLIPVRPALNRPSGPRPRMSNATNPRASTSGQQRPQIGRPVKVSPGAVIAPPKKPTEATGHFSCFKKPKESLIPVPDFSQTNKNDGDSSAQFSSAMQMSKSNFSSTTKVVKGNSVVTSTQTKSEMSASSQLTKLRGMSGLSVMKTSQTQSKQAQVEERSEISASKRNALEAIQKLQNQGLLIKKPRLDVSEDSDHSEHDSDEMGHDSNEEFDE